MRQIRAIVGLVWIFVCAVPSVQTASPSLLVQTFEDTQDTVAMAPLIVMAPGEVEISIEITPTVKTKELRAYADSGSFYRGSAVGLNGADSETVHTFKWRGFAVGEYQVVGMLVDSEGASEVVVRGVLKVVERHRRPWDRTTLRASGVVR